MSTENDTAEGQPPDRPLDPYTLRVVLAELDRRPTTPSEEVVSDLLATANPRARVVVLPELFTPRRNSTVTEWPCGVWLDGKAVHITGSVVTTETGPTVAGSILAAIEFAGGAQ